MQDRNHVLFNQSFDLSYLNDLEPYEGDYKESTFDLRSEIESLEQEMNGISLDSIPFTKADFIVLFLAGLTGATIDIVFGKPADGYNGLLKKAEEPTITDDFAGGLGKYLKKYDLKNNPIDQHIPGISVGDHRLYSYGHDLLRFFETLPVIMSGTGEIGVTGLGGVLTLEQAPYRYPTVDSLWEAIIVLALHLYKDYCSARSLPIPGSTILANLNDDTMPAFLDELTNQHEFNLRTVFNQVLSVAVIELIVYLYHFIVKKEDRLNQYDDAAYKEKKDKMLLMSHSIAMLFNTGKVVVTKNPAFINFPQILRIVKLAWNSSKRLIEKNHQAITKANLGIVKNNLEMMETLVLLDQSVYYTEQINRLIEGSHHRFSVVNKERKDNLAQQKEDLDDMMERLRRLNR